MSNQADHTIVRLRVPPELKKLIEESAEQNNRSQSAEMVALIEKAIEINELGGLTAKQLKEAGSMFAIGALLLMRTMLEKKLSELDEPNERSRIEIKISLINEIIEIFETMGGSETIRSL